MKHIVRFSTAVVAILMSISLVGCGGGGGGGGSTSPPTVTGTASEGALITGQTVKLKDANGKSAADATTGASNGVFSIDVSNLTAPFLVTVTGTKGSYISLAQADGKANINPITTMVVALAAGSSDVSALFTGLTPTQLSGINTKYDEKTALVSTSLKDVLSGFSAKDYFTGTVAAGTGMDAVFDTYQIAVNPTNGITVKTKGDTAVTVLTIPDATVKANTPDPLPPVNLAPVANAGPAQSVVAGAVVTLDGSASSDVNGDSLTNSWALTSKPSGSSATLSSATAVKPTFTADLPGAYVFTLVVNDGKLSSAAATVTITAAAANAAPVANAGSAQRVVAGALVTLDGSASSDANNDTLTFSWSITSKPDGSSASLSSTTAVKPTFTADLAGTYALRLVVNDGKLSSAAATVSITSIANQGSVSITW